MHILGQKVYSPYPSYSSPFSLCLCLLLFGCTLHICSKIFFDAFSVVLLKSFNLPTHFTPAHSISLSLSLPATLSLFHDKLSKFQQFACLNPSLSLCPFAPSLSISWQHLKLRKWVKHCTGKTLLHTYVCVWVCVCVYIVDKSCDCY